MNKIIYNHPSIIAGGANLKIFIEHKYLLLNVKLCLFKHDIQCLMSLTFDVISELVENLVTKALNDLDKS